MLRRAGPLTILLFAACVPGSRGTEPGPPPDPRAAVAHLVLGQYRAVERGDLDAWGEPLAADVFLLGSDPREVTTGRLAVLAGLRKGGADRLAAEVRRSYRSTRLTLGVAPGGRAAWADDEIDYTLAAKDKTRQIRLRMSELLAEVGGRFRIVAAHYSVPVGHQEAFDLAGTGKLPAPAAMGGDVAPGAEPVAVLFRRGITEPASLLADLLDGPNTVVVGTAPKEHWIGADTIRQRLAGLPPPSPRARLEPEGGVRAALTADGNAAWAAGNVRLVWDFGAGEQRLVFRSLGIYVREAGRWRVACVHSSVGIPD